MHGALLLVLTLMSMPKQAQEVYRSRASSGLSISTDSAHPILR